MRIRFITNLFIFLAFALLFHSESISFSLLNVPLDDPMVSDIYHFIDRVTLKYQLSDLLKNRRPYTYDEVYNILKRLEQEGYELTLIERQQLKSFISYFSHPDSLLTKRGKDYQFNLNLESGLISTYRGLPANPPGMEYAWQTRPIVTGHVKGNLAFSTDLRFFLITGTALGNTVRTEVEIDQGEDVFDTAGLVPSYAKFKLSWFDLLIGKENISWGPGKHGNLLLSAYALPMDMIQIRSTYENIGFQALTSIAKSPFGNKVLSGHRVDINLWNRLNLGISEIVVVGKKDFEVRFLNPFTIYTIAEPLGGGIFNSDVQTSRANLLISGDFELRMKRNLAFYGELMIDDFQPRYGLESHLHWGSKFGFQFGLYFVDPLSINNMDLRIEYTFINQYSYTHKRPINVYTHFNRPIGHRIGPDADISWIELRHQWTERISTAVSYEIERQGEQDINQARSPDAPYKDTWEFLSGITELRHGFSLVGRYSMFGDAIVKGQYTYWRINNLAHQEGGTDSQQELTITSLYRL